MEEKTAGKPACEGLELGRRLASRPEGLKRTSPQLARANNHLPEFAEDVDQGHSGSKYNTVNSWTRSETATIQSTIDGHNRRPQYNRFMDSKGHGGAAAWSRA